MPQQAEVGNSASSCTQGGIALKMSGWIKALLLPVQPCVLEEGCQLQDEGLSVPEQSENSSTAGGNKSDLIQFI